MSLIHCQNCGHKVSYTPDERCQNCNSKWWGYGDRSKVPFVPGILKPVQASHTPERVHTPSEAGWLIVHTEGKSSDIFDLMTGSYVIGRSSGASKPDIALNEDEHISRSHLVLKVESGTFIISDSKPSMNGTYVNGDPNRIDQGDLVRIQDGDTVQIGLTKLVLKTASVAGDKANAQRQVKAMPHIKTVRIK
ncbi:MAG: FHA domain-containing protein [Bacteroidota bacterium]